MKLTPSLPVMNSRDEMNFLAKGTAAQRPSDAHNQSLSSPKETGREAPPSEGLQSIAPNLNDIKQRRAKLKQATQDFEAIFVGMMLKEMRKTMTSDNPLFGNSSQAKYYQEMMDDAVAQQISRTGQFGFGNLLYKKIEHTLPPDPDAIVRQALKILP